MVKQVLQAFEEVKCSKQFRIAKIKRKKNKLLEDCIYNMLGKIVFTA
jgi:hypothetical protein